METKEHVLAELQREAHDLTMAVEFARQGVELLSEVMSPHAKAEGAMAMVATAVPEHPETRVLAQKALSRAIVDIQPGGPVLRHLGNQWVVFMYTLWEHEYRRRLATASGLDDKNSLKVPLIGDLGEIRHDIVHHRGIASKDNAGNCKVLKSWIEIGKPLHVDTQRRYEFLEMLWNELGARPVDVDMHPPDYSIWMSP